MNNHQNIICSIRADSSILLIIIPIEKNAQFANTHYTTKENHLHRKFKISKTTCTLLHSATLTAAKNPVQVCAIPF